MPHITLQPVHMFRTPENWAEIQDWINRHAPEDRAHLYTAAIMAWNLAAKLVAEAQARPDDAEAPQ